MIRRCTRFMLVAAVASAGLVGTAMAGPAAPALAAAPYWVLSSTSAPTNLPPGGEGKIIVTASNLGDATMEVSEKTPITLTDKLPPGLTAVSILGTQGSLTFPCSPPSQEPSCTDGNLSVLPSTGLKIAIKVKVDPKVTSGTVLVSEIKATGGGAPSASVQQPVRVDEHPAPFGVQKYELKPEEEGGAPATLAGSHPFQLTTSFTLNQSAAEEGVALPKNLKFNLPAGLIGNPIAIPRCSQLDFTTIVPGPANLCGPESAVGIAEVTINEPLVYPNGAATETVPVFNVEPGVGEPARLGFEVDRVAEVLDTSVRTGSDYGVVVTAKSTSQTAGVISSRVTIWGVPGDPRHNVSRGWECAGGGANNPEIFPECNEQKQPPAVPFLTLPTSCGTPMKAPMQPQSWVSGAEYLPPVESEFQESLTGCEGLAFSPSLAVEPDTQAGSTPAGLGTTVKMCKFPGAIEPGCPPAEETAGGRAQSAVKSTTVTLPEGLQLNPGAANGLEACAAFEVGLDPEVPEAAQIENDHFSPNPVGCPDRAAVGTVSIKSPDLQNRLTGLVYLAREHTNPFEAPLVTYLVAKDKASGVLVKLAGTVTPDPVTGRLVSTFENTPQVPFEELDLKFFTGPRASVTTPPLCGGYATETAMTPWSTGSPAAVPQSTFTVTSGPGGGPCPSNPLPFAPSLQAGSTNTQAAGFSPFTLTINRPDGQQALQGLTLHLPTGLAGVLASVTPCPEPQVSKNECGPQSLVGHSAASSGLGGEPFTLSGNVYLTGPYKGTTLPAGTPAAPFGLSDVTPAVAGPFNLGDVTVRSRIDVDPSTAAVTVTSDPFPTMLKGVPVQLKQVNVTTDRPNFQFNPTNCSPLSVSATLTGSQGASFPLSYPLKVTGCERLAFKPTFEANTEAHTSKADGASLRVRVTSTGLGAENIAKTKVTLPLALPSRLTTIQKACVDKVFEANPESCPEGSNIGTAIIHTPVFNNPLKGPAYLVSHGNAAFPDVEFVLKGEGLTVILDGKTDIKKGITTSTFETLPDAPFTEFETILPEGPHSALGANGDLCKKPLIMPTVITSQSGIVITQQTRIKVSGCPSRKGLTRAQRLAKALKACRKQHDKRKRAACERQARRRYAAKPARRR
ncbi:MAG TPA: hypothetical protein VNZ01_02915 [Solirubrobacteraceae bacterium]|jgi:hypothetical protein|nr:hypothetical protein [Solirubrobacteraceae bacterium]